MNLHEARCTSCGANLKIEPHKHTITCEFCGNTILAKNAIELAIVEVDKSKDIEKYRQNLDTSIKYHNIDDILRLSTLIKDIIPNDFEANYFFSFAQIKNNQPKYLNDFIQTPLDYTDDSLIKVLDHMSHHMDYRDKNKVESFITKVHPSYLETFKGIFKERLDKEDQYAIISRDVFICYSSEDQVLADKVVKVLEQDGHRCFIASRNLRPNDSDNYWNNIFEALDKSTQLLVISSESAYLSKDVQKELSYAIKKDKPRFEFKIDDTKPTLFFKDAFDGIKWVKGNQDTMQDFHPLLQRVFEEKKKYEAFVASDASIYHRPVQKNKYRWVFLLLLIGLISGGLLLAFNPFAPDYPAPTINLVGDSVMVLKDDQPFVDPGANAADYALNQLTVTVEENVEAFTEGTYTVRYTAVDEFGQESSQTRTVIIEGYTFNENLNRSTTLLTIDYNPTYVVMYQNNTYLETYQISNDLITVLDMNPSNITQASERVISHIKETYNDLRPSLILGLHHASSLSESIDWSEQLSLFSDEMDIVINAQSYENVIPWLEIKSTLESLDSPVRNHAIDTFLDYAPLSYSKETLNNVAINDFLTTWKEEAIDEKIALENAILNDTIKPVVTLNGDAQIVLNIGETFTDPSVSVTDNVDQTFEIIKNDTVNMNEAGEYTITYQVTDRAGNVSNIVTRTVIVIDETNPIIILNGPRIVELELGETYIEQGASFSSNDALDVIVEGSVDTTTAGTYVLTYKVASDTINIDPITRSIIVKDTADYQIPVLEISAEEITQESIRFSLDITDIDELGALNQILLYKGSTLVQTLQNLNTRFIQNLQSDTEYTLKVFYSYTPLDEEETLTFEKVFKTTAYEAPEVSIQSVESTETSLEVKLSVEDPLEISLFEKVQVLKDDVLINESFNQNDLLFEGLMANQSYDIIVVYSYDLNDGQGPQLITLEDRIKTTAYQRPRYRTENISLGFETISFNGVITDPDNTLVSSELVVSNNDEIIKTFTNLSEIVLSDLFSERTYTFEISLSYDLEDGSGVVTHNDAFELTTNAYSIPSLELEATTLTVSSVAFDITIEDTDERVQSITHRIYMDETLIETLEGSSNIFKSLLSNQTYRIVSTATYNLNNGNGVQTVQDSITVKTLSESIPTVSVSGTSFSEAIELELTIEDPHQFVRTHKIELKKDTVVDSTNLLEWRIDQLSSNTTYIVLVTLYYTLNDGQGEKTITYEVTYKTLENQTPNIELINILSTQERIDFEIKVTDEDNVGALTAIELYQGETLVESLDDLSLRSFDNLLSNSAYEIRVTYEYDLKDGTGVQSIIVDSYDYSEKYEAVLEATDYYGIFDNTFYGVIFMEGIRYENAKIYAENYGGYLATITSETELNNISSIIPLSTTLLWIGAETNEQGELEWTTGEKFDYTNWRDFIIEVENNQAINFRTYEKDWILSYKDYGSGGIIVEIDQLNSILTSSKIVPEADISVVELGKNSMDIDVLITDPDGVSIFKSLEIFKDSTLIKTITSMSESFVIDQLEPETEYKIKLTIEYDLNDKTGIQTKVVEETVSTTLLNGLGTELSPYLIENTTDFMNMDTTEVYYYQLTQNLDLSEINYEPFVLNGHFNGAGFTISHLTMLEEQDDVAANLGLFTTLKGSVKNLVISSFNLEADTFNNVMGGLVASENDGLIESVTLSGIITTDVYGTSTVGGVVGINRGVIKDVFITTTIDINSTGAQKTGGIAGINLGTIEEIFIDLSLTVEKVGGSLLYAGGITGEASGDTTIRQVVAKLDMISETQIFYGTTLAGGLVGMVSTSGDGLIENSYTTGNMTNFTHAGGALGQIVIQANGRLNLNSHFTDLTIESRSSVGHLIANYNPSDSRIVLNQLWASEIQLLTVSSNQEEANDSADINVLKLNEITITKYENTFDINIMSGFKEYLTNMDAVITLTQNSETQDINLSEGLTNIESSLKFNEVINLEISIQESVLITTILN